MPRNPCFVAAFTSFADATCHATAVSAATGGCPVAERLCRLSGATLTCIGLGCSMCSTFGLFRPGAECTRPDAFAALPLLTNDDPPYCVGLGQRAGFTQTRCPFICARAFALVTSYSRTTLTVIPHPLASGRRVANPVSSPLPSFRTGGYFPCRASALPPHLA
jgi:hypothetical protein